MSGKVEGAGGNIDINPTTNINQPPLRGSIPDDSSLLSPEEASPVDLSPQSFAALKQAFDHMVPQLKALQTDRRTLRKENEELRRKLTEKGEDEEPDMSNYGKGYAEELTARGQAPKRMQPVIDHVRADTKENAESPRASPGAGGNMDSAINLRDESIDSVATLDTRRGAERTKLLRLCLKLILFIPSERHSELAKEDRGWVPQLLLELRDQSETSEDRAMCQSMLKHLPIQSVEFLNEKLKTINMLTPADVEQLSGDPGGRDITRGRGATRASPPGHRIPPHLGSDDEDIYTSGFPTGQGSPNNREFEANTNLVPVHNACEILTRFISYVSQSMEVTSRLKNELEEARSQQPLYKQSHTKNYSKYEWPQSPPPVISMSSANAVPQSRGLPAIHNSDYLKTTMAVSDPGRPSISAFNRVTNERYHNSHPNQGKWSQVPKRKSRPSSQGDTGTQLYELPVKYPPSLERFGSDLGTQQQQQQFQNGGYGHVQRPPDYGQEYYDPSIAMDHDIYMRDGQPIHVRGPPEMAGPRDGEQEDNDEHLRWIAERNPDSLQFARDGSPLSGSGAAMRRPPINSRTIMEEDHLVGNMGLAGSSQKFGKMDMPVIDPTMDEDYHTMTGNDSNDPKVRDDFSLLHECPVCKKQFDPNLPEIAISSHVNLHFDDDKGNFEVIE